MRVRGQYGRGRRREENKGYILKRDKINRDLRRESLRICQEERVCAVRSERHASAAK